MTETIESCSIELVVISDKSTGDILIESTNTIDKNKTNGYKIILAQFNEPHETSKQIPFVQQIIETVPDLNKLISINLSYCNLNSLPDDFYVLRLKTLDISNNDIVDIPQCLLIGLNELEELNLSANKITLFNDVPKSINSLKVLRLCKTNLQNPPNWFLAVNCKNLEEFYYNFNTISSLEFHNYVFAMKYNLKKVEFVNSSVRQEDLRFIKEVRTLKHLNLSNTCNESANANAITDFDSLFNEPKWSFIINTLILNYGCISILPESIGNLRYLKELHLENNYLSWLPHSITKLQNLHTLNLSRNQISILAYDFNQLQNMEILNISHNLLSSISLTNMPRLIHIDLYSNNIESMEIDETVEFIDVENNHINHVNLLIDNYETKKLALRLKLINTNRIDGHKETIDTDTYSSRGSSLVNYSDDDKDVLNYTDDDESWDYEATVNSKLGAVTLSDDEYKGEEIITINNNNASKQSKPISMEEIDIYVDAD